MIQTITNITFLTNNKSPTTGCIIILTLFSSKFEVLLFLKISIRKLGPNKNKKKRKIKKPEYMTQNCNKKN